MSSRLSTSSSLPRYRTPSPLPPPFDRTSKRLSIWDIILSYTQPESVPPIPIAQPQEPVAPRQGARSLESQVRYPPNAWSDVEWDLQRYPSREEERGVFRGEKGLPMVWQREALPVGRKPSTVFERLQELEKANGEKETKELSGREQRKTVPWTSLLGALPTFMLLTAVILFLVVLLSPTFLFKDLGLLTLHLDTNSTLVLGPLGACHRHPTSTTCTPGSLAPSSSLSLPSLSPLYPTSLLLTTLLLSISSLLLALMSFPRRHSTPHTTRRLALVAGLTMVLGLCIGVAGTAVQRVELNGVLEVVGEGLGVLEVVGEGLGGPGEGLERVEVGEAFGVLWSALALVGMAGVGLVGLGSGNAQEGNEGEERRGKEQV